MSSVTEAWKAWREGFVNKDSSRLAEFFTDDFQFIGSDIGRAAGGNRTRQETLDFTAAGGSPTSIDDLEVLYENDDVAVLYHIANRPNVVMALYTKRGDKFSHCRTVRQEV